jgi:hypothetical protein
VADTQAHSYNTFGLRGMREISWLIEAHLAAQEIKWAAAEWLVASVVSFT